ncbi:hypothetical protein GQX73_g6840 [Xylaria multiplex]|uniref:Uncharacterized protein n=1 Tax=Xylaria multiplex TaxID=323545 RepID=A0A7C8ILM5_9PEZI|nr:hypothetical protein GQX73_g6840 [Xylaria multiplex]
MADPDGPQSVPDTFRAQWTKPTDVFSILLLLGAEVIQRALAALAGGTPAITPVAFSFGWVSYAISALLSTVSESRLVQAPPEAAVQVFNLKSGYTRANRSWLLARLVKTYSYWMPDEVRVTERAPTRYRRAAAAGDLSSGVEAGRPRYAALCVSVFRWRDTEKGPRARMPGRPVRDWVWWSGVGCMVVQLGVAAIPLGLYGDWSILLIAAAGTALALVTGSLPQWREEKWHARRQKKDVALTLGNGTRHVIIVLGAERGLDLEDLAGGLPGEESRVTQITSIVLTVLWIALLLTSTGIEDNTWYLLAVGGLGMVQNVVVAAAPRRPDALGLPIELVTKPYTIPATPLCPEGGNVIHLPEIYAEEKVMWTLMKLEMEHENFGKALVDEFFPGKLMKWEEEWWASDDADTRRKSLDSEQKKYYAKRP